MAHLKPIGLEDDSLARVQRCWGGAFQALAVTTSHTLQGSLTLTYRGDRNGTTLTWEPRPGVRTV